MARKIIAILICLLLIPLNVLAGDIPEDLMKDNQQALLIGEIVEAESKEYTIKPLNIMMGNVEQEEIKVDKFEYYGTNDIPKEGDYLIIVLLKNNEIYESRVFKTTSDDYKTLELISERYPMVERYEKYINNGEYIKAQGKIDRKLKEKS